MGLKMWNMTSGFEQNSVHKTLEQWENFYNSVRLSSHYDMLEEKWYFYERTKDGTIYQISEY